MQAQKVCISIFPIMSQAWHITHFRYRQIARVRRSKITRVEWITGFFFFFFSDKLNDFFKNITLSPDSHIALRSLGVNFKMHKYFSILTSSLERHSDVLGEHRLTSNSQPQFQSSLSVICSANFSGSLTL